MTRSRFFTQLSTVLLVAFAIASTAQAQATRTWVSGVGDDANPCSRTAPCKTFAGAISKTAAGGEISVLDPGGFGAVTITKSITINGDGTLAGILAAGTNGVIVNAGVNDVIILRNISINGAGTGLNGIRYLAGRTLVVDSCTIYGFTTRGIDVVHTSTSTPGELVVRNTRFTNNTQVGIRIDTAVGAVSPSALIEGVSVNRSLIGIDVLKSSVATVTNTVVSDITNQAYVSENSAVLNLTDCVASKSGTGVSAFSAASTIRIANCDIFNNTTAGVNVAVGATGITFSNNRIFGNGTNVVGALTPQGNS